MIHVLSTAIRATDMISAGLLLVVVGSSSFFSLAEGRVASCTIPSPLANHGLTTQGILDKMAQLEVPYLFLPMAAPLIAGLVSNYETPIQFRLANIHGTNVYNVVAMYDSQALDIWGRSEYRICSEEFASADDKRAHETVAAAYAFAYSGINIVPQAKAGITNLMENVLLLPMELLDGYPDVSTPWGLAKALVDQHTLFAESDGWNADGALRNEFNKLPYSDFDFADVSGNEYEEYIPRKFKGCNKKSSSRGEDIVCDKKGGTKKKSKKGATTPWNWEPLLESDGNGYFVRQEHVTPFAGFTGRLYGLSEEEYEAFESPLPDYDYCFEADFVLGKTATLATSDTQKMEVELFDSKFTSLLPLQIQWSVKSGFSELEFWFYDMTLVIAMYDATMLVWRDKVLFDLVRPTTVVHALKGGQEVTTFAGPFEGKQAIPGQDWQPYIRTMPHAEYPSGSSCICTAYAETMQALTQNDELGVSVEQSFAAGTSKLEPGLVPAVGLLFTYNKWSEIQEICGESRLYGGMHFSQAVPAGEELCTGLGDKIATKANLLLKGYATGAMVDFEDRAIRVKTKEYEDYAII